LHNHFKFCVTMPRKKGDGRGRLGGRSAGTPNKDKPLKTFLRQHSIAYFTPSIEEEDNGKKTGRTLSQFDLDCMTLDPVARVDAEIKLLNFHTPKMQSTSVDVSVSEMNLTLTERLAQLASGLEISAESDE
jgi:hypothetical protein